MNDGCIDYIIYICYICVCTLPFGAVKLLLFSNLGVVSGSVIEILDQVGTLGSQSRSLSSIFLKDRKREKSMLNGNFYLKPIVFNKLYFFIIFFYT